MVVSRIGHEHRGHVDHRDDLLVGEMHPAHDIHPRSVAPARRVRRLLFARDRAGKLHPMGDQGAGHLVLYVHNIDRSALSIERARWKQLKASNDGPLGRIRFALFSSGRTHSRAAAHSRSARTRSHCRAAATSACITFGLKVGDTDDELRDAVRRCQEAAGCRWSASAITP